MERAKRVYIETYGCQMNDHDSERTLRLLERSGYVGTQNADEAELILVNTCSVREKPEHKVYSALGRFKRQKKKGTILGVMGCVAQQEGQRLLDRVPHLDVVLGTHAIPLLPDLLKKVEFLGQRVCETNFDPEGRYLDPILPEPPPARVKSLVTIMQGCDRFCSFCIVPYLRGRERSRPSREIIEEVKRLAAMGVKEVCLLGQNVNAYGKGLPEGTLFPDLLAEINAIEGLERIRFTTSHPADLSEKLVQAFSGLEKLCEHIHLPFQSGSDRILKGMHRGYTRDQYLERVWWLREACPSIAITADVMVGFPGEEEEDFQETLDLMNKVRFDDLFSFKYSARKGTRAAQRADRVDEKIKQERLALLQEVQRAVTFEKHLALEGRDVEVLVEGPSRQSPRDVAGRTRSNQVVNVEGDRSLVGQLVSLHITKATPHSLRGELSRKNDHPSSRLSPS